MLHLSNEEIRSKLLELNYKCGPVTDTTRDVYLKKLEALRAMASNIDRKNGDEKLTDGELRAQLLSFGQTVAPITATNRHIYVERLKSLKSKKMSTDSNEQNLSENYFQSYTEGYDEPMDVD